MKNRYRITTETNVSHETSLHDAIYKYGNWIKFYTENKGKYGVELRKICIFDLYGKKEKLLACQYV